MRRLWNWYKNGINSYNNELWVAASIAVGCVLLVLAIVCLASLCSVLYQLQLCDLYDGSDVAHKFLLFGGCKVQVPSGIWVSADAPYALELLGG